jgi:molybdate transport system substrate-binding protein
MCPIMRFSKMQSKISHKGAEYDKARKVQQSLRSLRAFASLRGAFLLTVTPRALIIFAFSFLLAACSSHEPANRQANPQEITVAAAADLAPAFEELGKAFEQETGIKTIFMFGSTGNLAKQIENGAPVDLFAAANISFIEELERKGLVLPDTKALYARGRITLWTRADNPLNLNRVEDLARPDVKRIAIANPEHAPYGVAAREALQATGIWNAVESKIVLGENVRQALQYAETGNADAAITALSLSTQSNGHWTLIPEELHRPLDQAMTVIKGALHEQQARQFAAFINGDRGRATMRRYGFILPGEEPLH